MNFVGEFSAVSRLINSTIKAGQMYVYNGDVRLQRGDPFVRKYAVISYARAYQGQTVPVDERLEHFDDVQLIIDDKQRHFLRLRHKEHHPLRKSLHCSLQNRYTYIVSIPRLFRNVNPNPAYFGAPSNYGVNINILHHVL